MSNVVLESHILAQGLHVVDVELELGHEELRAQHVLLGGEALYLFGDDLALAVDLRFELKLISFVVLLKLSVVQNLIYVFVYF